MNNKIKGLLVALLLGGSLAASAQIGEHRNDFAVGFNGGYVLSKVGFQPDVQQKQHGGITAGFSMKYTISMITGAILANWSLRGWNLPELCHMSR